MVGAAGFVNMGNWGTYHEIGSGGVKPWLPSRDWPARGPPLARPIPSSCGRRILRTCLSSSEYTLVEVVMNSLVRPLCDAGIKFVTERLANCAVLAPISLASTFDAIHAATSPPPFFQQ